MALARGLIAAARDFMFTVTCCTPSRYAGTVAMPAGAGSALISALAEAQTESILRK